MKRNATPALLIAMLLIGFCLQAQTIRYVTAGGTGDGFSWRTASGDLQAMINASVSGDEVWVATGTYKPTLDYYSNSNPSDPRGKMFKMRSSVGIYGGFAGLTTETSRSQRNWKTNVTTLSGDIGTPDDNSDNCYNVVYNYQNGLDNTAVLDGFTVTGANGGTQYGAGMYNTSSSPLIANCIFLDNLGTAYGAGVKNYYCSPTFTNCVFSGNSAQLGAGLFNVLASPQLTNCAFIGNSATANGGGMWNQSSSPTLKNCTFSGNTASNGGGAIYNYTTSVASSPTLTNCILWGDGGGEVSNSGSSIATITYSIVQGGYEGTGNLNQDPLFVSATDLHLQSCSPAIDAGTNAANSTTQDLDGNPRKVRTIDMGAYEYQGAPSTTPSITTQPFATQSVCLNNTPIALKVVATGDALSYQWYSNTTNSNTGGTAISNATASTYTPSNTTAGTTYYYVVVSGTCSPGAISDLATVTVNASPARLYVNAGATGANTGLSWQDAFTNLQSALNYTCSGSLTEIWVAQGTYKPTTGTDRNVSFAMKNGVAIYGGFSGTETNLSQRNVKANVTILSGDLNGDDGADFANNGDNSCRVVYNNYNNGLNGSAVLDGFTITGGNNNLPYREDYGGGMVNDGSSPSVINCTFLRNAATGGGGMYNYTCSPAIINCVFLGNKANIGGAMYNYTGSSPALTNCSFSGNTATGGGAIYNHFYCFPTLAACILWSDTGGEVYDGIFSNTSVSNSIVQGGCPQLAACVTVLNQDPLFVSATDLHLQPCSPAIDAGNDAANNTLTDLDGNQRKVNAITGGNIIDMGAYEFQKMLPTFYEDKDGDGFGNASVSKQTCTSPQNYVVDNTDCNDNQVLYQDNDGDGFGSNVKVACGNVTNNQDCDDVNATINPATVWVLDADGDGYYTGNPITQCSLPGNGYTIKGSKQGGDCNDGNTAVHPNAPEICGNGIDDNCNGQVDENCGACRNATNLTTTNITASGATLTWKSPATPQQWQVEYKSLSTGSKWTTITVSGTARTLLLTSLQAKQRYKWNIRAKCNGTWTAYSSDVQFTTLAAIRSSITPANVGTALEEETLVVPNLLHRAQLWRIPSLPANNQVLVTDMNGKVVLQARNYQNSHSFSNVTSGIYVYQIITTDTNGHSKIFKGKLLITD